MAVEVECKEVVITTLLRRGDGIEGIPVRCITQVYTKDGVLIAERDPFPTTFTPEDMRQFARYYLNEKSKSVDITVELALSWANVTGK